MSENKRILTQESFDKLQKEHDDLVINKRKEIADKIKEAREQGDLSENAEYDAAKDEQRDIEARISELEEIFKNCEIIDEDKIDFSQVHIGCTVKVRDQKSKKELIFHIVSSTDVNSRERKISNDSPIGAALCGREVNDVVDIETPMGTVRYKIIQIDDPSKK